MASAPESWAIEYADQLIVGNPASGIGVCCLWSSKHRLQSILDASQYAVIGNLYSRAGINPMLRNILFNPTIRHLVLTGKSLTDSDEALLCFFEKGVDASRRIIGSGGQIERDLPLEALNEVRQNVRLIDLRGERDLAEVFPRLAKELPELPPFAEPRQFPKSPPEAHSFPSEFAGFTIRRRTIYDAWTEIIWAVMTLGRTSSTDYGLHQKELLALMSVIEDPTASLGKVPHWSPFTSEDVERYIETFFNPERTNEVSYNYGYRLQTYWGENQIESLVAELRRSSFSRRAVASLWNPVEDSKSGDPPCLTTIQATVRDGQLNLIGFIRSNDMFRAYPINAAALGTLQARLAQRLGGVTVGALSVLSYSAHIYSDCWDACQLAMADAAKQRRRFEQDHRGSFVFRIANGFLAADHYSPEGDLVQTFTAKSEKELNDLILPFVGRTDHGMYLAREIARLAKAYESEEAYEQDRVPKSFRDD